MNRNKEFICKYCGKKFTKFKALAGHIATCKRGVNPFYGKHHTKETIELLRTKAKQREPRRGWKHTEEAKSKMRGPRKPKEIKFKVCSICGKVIKEKYHLQKFHNPAKRLEVREEISKNRVGKLTGENNPFYGKHHTKETITKIRKKRLKQVFPVTSKLEILMYDSLLKYFPETQLIRSLPIELPSKGTIVDIAIPERKVAIYCDGCYWHSCPICFPKKKKIKADFYITKTLRERGWKVFRFWGHSIIKDADALAKVVSA